jgi:long-chain acyl-CoA synthetase
MQARHAIDLFTRRISASGRRVAMRHKLDGTWRTLTWSDMDRAAREIAGGLRALGLSLGDRVCLLANTRWEWIACDVGILMAGGVTVPIYQSNTPDQVDYIVTDSGSKIVIVEDPAQRAKVGAATGARTVMMNGRVDGVTTLAELRAEGQKWIAAHPGALEKGWEEIRPEHIFTIVYTSGTTGPPKGVVLTHKNIAFECKALEHVLSIDESDEQLLFLPLAHIFARILEWTAISRGCVTAFAEGIPELIANMKEVRPTFMGAVPRVYEKAYMKIQAGFDEKRKSPAGKTIIDWALSVGRQLSREQQAGRAPTLPLAIQARLANRLVFEKVQATFGGRLRYFLSGGAPLAREIAELFHATGILILEGYGLTETTASTNLNRPNAYKFGTVGQAIPGSEVKIAADGEVLMRGDNILREYFGKPEATREAIDAEGWFHSGDIGVIDEDGYLRITDRKKDIIVTAGGKNVAPQNLEGALKAACPYVSQVMVHGDKRPYLVALVTVNEEILKASGQSDAKAIIQAAVDKLNSQLPSYETIKKIAVLPQDFTQETGELTPTLKVKRKFCSEKYKTVLDGLY